MPPRIRQFRGPITRVAGNLPYRTSTQEQENPSVCQVERLQRRAQFMLAINRPGR